jgi:glycerol-3-phosphate acyltransferase PlsX
MIRDDVSPRGERNTIRIAVDAMGGDFAPRNVVDGTMEALKVLPDDVEIVMVGKEDRIREELRQFTTNGAAACEIVHAPEVISMDDVPTVALKQKKDSSIAVGLSLQKEGKVDAFVSAGNTGAVMSASTIILGRLKGVGRPTIGAFLPSEKGVCLLLDAGANVDCRPHHLVEFAIMGSIYASFMLQHPNPMVGLLSIGEESTKGDERTQEAHRLLSKSKLNFIGNVEGRDILKGKAQVVVCDGFVGNVVLKFAESVIGLLTSRFRDYASHNLFRKLWTGLMYGTMKKLLRDFDYQEHGGVPLLGVNGVSIIGHGGSTPKAIKNMVLRAEEMVRKNINRHIEQALATN